ncbi:MAG TPA: glycosyltransferase family 2 protein [Chthoniobacterales bacterium]|jgi:cellulose synthase/poly-beta-1,6-N-acetylglucosamine synthase-like glycosyltransferase
MMSAFATLAWTALAVLLYVYIVYPALLALLARFRTRVVTRKNIAPSVTLIISAYNEERTIEKKLRNTVALDYPKEQLEILVVSDASTDKTDEIVAGFAGQGVKLLRQARRQGKTAGLNAAVRAARGDVLVFSDANILYRTDAVGRLVQSFADPSVGCVTGDSRYDEDEVSQAHAQENAYWGYERFIRAMESRLGSTVGGDGAIFAIRRGLYTPLAADAINDLMTPLQIVLGGHRAVFEPEAVGFEPTAGDFRGEFRRKRRIVNRSWHAVMSVPQALSIPRMGCFAWQVWSHKVLRWLALPLVLLGALGCIFAAPLGLVYRLGAWGFAASVALALFGAIIPESAGRWSRLPHTALYFYLVNVAALLGIISAMAGRVETFWTPEREKART